MQKPRLSFWQIWNMSFGFLGIQFGWGLQMANMSAIYEYMGAKPEQIPMLWLAAPLTGMLVQPIIGSMSDRTWGRPCASSRCRSRMLRRSASGLSSAWGSCARISTSTLPNTTGSGAWRAQSAALPCSAVGVSPSR